MARQFSIIEVPYDLGLENVGPGAGPRRFLESGIDTLLAYRDQPAEVQHVRLRDADCRGEDAAVDVCRQLRGAVRSCYEQGVIPVVLAGNANVALGVLAGLEGADAGIVWMAPDPSLDPILFDEGVRTRVGWGGEVNESLVCLIHPGEEPGPYPLNAETVYLHIDLDLLGAGAQGGMDVDRAAALVRVVARELPLGAVTLAGYNPGWDHDGRLLAAGLNLLLQLK